MPGMIIGVPLFAVIYAGIKNLTNRGLRRRDLPVDTGAYMNVGAINENHVFVEYNQEAYRKRVGRESNLGKVEDSFRHLFRFGKKDATADQRYPINLAIPSSYTPDTLDEDKDTKTAEDQKNAEEESAYEEYDNKDQQ